MLATRIELRAKPWARRFVLGLQEAHHAAQPTAAANGALPNRGDAPSFGAKPSLDSGVACDVRCQLCAPEVHVALGLGQSVAAAMPVPEAAMHEDDLVSARKHQVRRAGQTAHVQPKPEAQRVQRPTNDNLRLCVLATDARHERAASFGVEAVHLAQMNGRKGLSVVPRRSTTASILSIVPTLANRGTELR